jgi:geranylgeranyl diphosphate synthase type II
MGTYGCLEHARRMAHGLAGAAHHEAAALYAALPESRDKQFIAALPRWVLSRA